MPVRAMQRFGAPRSPHQAKQLRYAAEYTQNVALHRNACSFSQPVHGILNCARERFAITVF